MRDQLSIVVLTNKIDRSEYNEETKELRAKFNYLNEHYSEFVNKVHVAYSNFFFMGV